MSPRFQGNVGRLSLLAEQYDNASFGTQVHIEKYKLTMEFVSVINILSCLCALSILVLLANEITATGEVVFAVNCGGPDHTDLNGVHYQADKLGIGTASDFGKQLSIGRVAPLDQILYQTERYHLSNFAYDIPIKEDGDYVLVLKFSEVYFQGPKLKV